MVLLVLIDMKVVVVSGFALKDETVDRRRRIGQEENQKYVTDLIK